MPAVLYIMIQQAWKTGGRRRRKGRLDLSVIRRNAIVSQLITVKWRGYQLVKIKLHNKVATIMQII